MPETNRREETLDLEGKPAAFPPIDVSFERASKDITRFMPQVRLALAVLRKDHHETRQSVRQILANEEGSQMLTALLDDWETIAFKLAALARLIETAHTRTVISFCVVAPNNPTNVQFMDLDKLEQHDA